jgi:aminoglycoside 6-adenylyltransferase
VRTDYTQLLDHLTPLLRDSDAVVAAAVIGSRTSQPDRDHADLDLLVFTDQPEQLLEDNSWLSWLGRIWASTIDRSLPGLPVKRLLLDHAAQVDLLILAPDAATELPSNARAILADTARRGFKPLKEGGPVPDGLAELAEAAGAALSGRPSQEQFSQLVAQFWVNAVRAARRLADGEVWAANRIVDGPMKDALVELRAWVVRAVKGAEADTFWRGRHLEEWAGPRFTADLAATCGPLEAGAVRHGLTETMDLFRLLAIQAASRWSLDYAEGLDRRVTVWVRTWD